MPLSPASSAARVAGTAVGGAGAVVIAASEHFFGEEDGVFGVGEEGDGAGAFVVVVRCHYLDNFGGQGSLVFRAVAEKVKKVTDRENGYKASWDE